MHEKNTIKIGDKTIRLAQGETPESGEHTGETHAGVSHEEGGTPLTEHSAWQFSLNGLFVAVFILILGAIATSRINKIPGRTQAAAENLVEGLTNFVVGIVGPKGKKFVPFIGALFLYIVFSNLTGLLPLNAKQEGKTVGTYFVGPMANISMTFALGIIVFCVVQYTAFKEQGFIPRIKHLAGPVWWLSPLIFTLEVIGELIRPLSLSVRLFGNIFGEEMVLASLITLLATGLPAWLPLPLHFPILFLGLLTAVVQAGVFCLLTCVYLKLAVETHEHGEHAGHDEEHGVQDVPAHSAHAPATAH